MAFPLPRQDQTCVVTGASSGIGAAIAREFAARGYNVTLVARRGDRLATLAGELEEAHGVRAAARPCDITDAAARDALFAAIAGAGDEIAVLVNNAGRGSAGAFHEQTPDGELGQIELNVSALVALTAAVLPRMVRLGDGAILNVASTAAFQPIPRQAVYAATKAFVSSFSEAINAELHGTGVTCTTLYPGPVHTEFFAGMEDAIGRAPEFVWMTAEDTAKAGVDALVRGKRGCTPGALNKVSSIGGRHSPRTVLLPLMRRFYPVANNPRDD